MYLLKALLLLALATASSVLALANEGAATEAPENFNYSGKQDQSWEVIQTKLGALKTKVDAQTSVINALVVKKASMASGEENARKNEELKIQHAKLESMVKEYNELNDEYLTRFPERGVKEKRVYQRIKLKTLDSFEDDFTLRGKLNKLHGKVLKQYPSAIPVSVKKSKKPIQADDSEKAGGSSDVTDPIQLKK